jgi:hypothetical protein
MTPAEQSFKIARSDILDAFAELESEVITLLVRFNGDAGCPTRPLAQKLESLAGLKPAPSLSKKRKAEIAAVIDEIKTLLGVRADIVHSRLQIVPGPTPSALFPNAADANSPYPQARLMTRENMAGLEDQVRKIAGRLRA